MPWLPYDPAFYFGVGTQRIESKVSRTDMHMFLTALFKIAKHGSNASIINRRTDVQNVAYLYNRMLLKLNKDGNLMCARPGGALKQLAQISPPPATQNTQFHLFELLRVAKSQNQAAGW